MFSLVRNQLLWNAKARNDMVEEKASRIHSRAIECGHGFNPLCEIVNDEDDVMMPSCGCWFAFH